MKRLTILLCAVLVSGTLTAQINRGGEPYAFSHPVGNPAEVTMPAVDVQKYIDEDEAESRNNDGIKRPFRFGAELNVNISPENTGSWKTLPDGGHLWQLRITSEGAKSLNFIFDRFYIPEGGRVFIYTPDRKYVAGAFTHQSLNPERVFSTSLYPGNSVIIECYEPLSATGETDISLSTVVHGYRNFLFGTDKGNYGNSGSCNININCPEGAGWQTEKRAVALILKGGYAHCTGTLINNTSNDGTPYFLTAYHCIDGYSPSTFVFVFKNEANSCSGTTGPTIYTLNNASVIASGSNSDFALLRLNDTVPLSYNPYYAGWSRTSSAATSAAGIHHPSGDVKKISLTGRLSSSSYNGSSDDGTHWKVSPWTDGTTEGGSSGSAIFNQNHLIVGQLHGGTASCNEPQGVDYYGKIAYSWTNNSASSSSARLKDWLDPNNTGATTCQGYDPCTSSMTNNAKISDDSTITEICGNTGVVPKIEITNRGNSTLSTLVLKCSLDGQLIQTANWSGNLSLNNTDRYSFRRIRNLAAGNHSIKIWSELPNNSSDEDRSDDTVNVQLSVTDGFQVGYRARTSFNMSYFSSVISWTVKDEQGNTVFQKSSMPSQEISETDCLPEGCYTMYITYNRYISSYKQSFMFEGLVGGEVVASGAGVDSLRFCTSDLKINTSNGDFGIKIFPNPTSNDKSVAISTEANVRDYQILDMAGKICLCGKMENGFANVSLSGFSEGIYLIRVFGEDGSASRKLIVGK